jgi:glycosyltransferase involved in cell wall biosynthesis
MTPTVTVIVAARNERERLPRCIDALRRQTFGRTQFEIVVVNDGSSDGTREWALAQDDLQTLCVDEADPYRARNAGAAKSDAALLAFTDAHCTAAPNWLERLCAAFADEHVGVATGRLGYRDDASALVRLYGYHHATKMAFIQRRGIEQARFGHAANLAVRRSLFDACGGFRALPLPGDTDLLQRIHTHHPQTLVHYEPTAVVNRQSTRSLRDLLHNTIRHARLNHRLAAAGKFRTLTLQERRAVFAACRREYALSALDCAALAGTLAMTTLAYNGARWQRRRSA